MCESKWVLTPPVTTTLGSRLGGGLGRPFPEQMDAGGTVRLCDSVGGPTLKPLPSSDGRGVAFVHH